MNGDQPETTIKEGTKRAEERKQRPDVFVVTRVATSQGDIGCCDEFTKEDSSPEERRTHLPVTSVGAEEDMRRLNVRTYQCCDAESSFNNGIKLDSDNCDRFISPERCPNGPERCPNEEERNGSTPKSEECCRNVNNSNAKESNLGSIIMVDEECSRVTSNRSEEIEINGDQIITYAENCTNENCTDEEKSSNLNIAEVPDERFANGRQKTNGEAVEIHGHDEQKVNLEVSPKDRCTNVVNKTNGAADPLQQELETLTLNEKSGDKETPEVGCQNEVKKHPFDPYMMQQVSETLDQKSMNEINELVMKEWSKFPVDSADKVIKKSKAIVEEIIDGILDDEKRLECEEEETEDSILARDELFKKIQEEVAQINDVYKKTGIILTTEDLKQPDYLETYSKLNDVPTETSEKQQSPEALKTKKSFGTCEMKLPEDQQTAGSDAATSADSKEKGDSIVEKIASATNPEEVLERILKGAATQTVNTESDKVHDMVPQDKQKSQPKTLELRKVVDRLKQMQGKLDAAQHELDSLQNQLRVQQTKLEQEKTDLGKEKERLEQEKEKLEAEKKEIEGKISKEETTLPEECKLKEMSDAGKEEIEKKILENESAFPATEQEILGVEKEGEEKTSQEECKILENEKEKLELEIKECGAKIKEISMIEKDRRASEARATEKEAESSKETDEEDEDCDLHKKYKIERSIGLIRKPKLPEIKTRIAPMRDICFVDKFQHKKETENKNDESCEQKCGIDK